jgi:hypothetical protein
VNWQQRIPSIDVAPLDITGERSQALAAPAEMYLCADLATRICTVDRTELRRGLSRPGIVRVFRFAALFC